MAIERKSDVEQAQAAALAEDQHREKVAEQKSAPAGQVEAGRASVKPEQENPALAQKRENVNIDVPKEEADVSVRLTAGNENVQIVSVAGKDFNFGEDRELKVTPSEAALLTDPALGRLPEGDDEATVAEPIVEVSE